MGDNLERNSQPQAGQGPPKRAASFPVIGLGASAGGLRALRDFFTHMPAESGMAFVIIMHLSSKHESHAAELLQATTEMPVTQVTEAVKVEPNHAYVIPPTKNLEMSDGQQQIQQDIDTRQGLRDETPYTSPTGVEGFYEYIFTPVIASDGTVEVVAGSTRDITERKQAGP
jgi:chemotaxis response regulator CheB